MKIVKAVLEIEGLFNGLEVDFMDVATTSIHYIVGNNGSGKTHLLQHLYKVVAGAQSGGDLKNTYGKVLVNAKVSKAGQTESVVAESVWTEISSGNRVTNNMPLKKQDTSDNFVDNTTVSHNIQQAEKNIGTLCSVM